MKKLIVAILCFCLGCNSLTTTTIEGNKIVDYTEPFITVLISKRFDKIDLTTPQSTQSFSYTNSCNQTSVNKVADNNAERVVIPSNSSGITLPYKVEQQSNSSFNNQSNNKTVNSHKLTKSIVLETSVVIICTSVAIVLPMVCFMPLYPIGCRLACLLILSSIVLYNADIFVELFKTLKKIEIRKLMGQMFVSLCKSVHLYEFFKGMAAFVVATLVLEFSYYLVVLGLLTFARNIFREIVV
jgi:hypothetical protein